MGRHRDHPRKRQNRGAPSRPSGECDLHRQGPYTHALGRPSRVHGRGRAGRLHLRAPLRSAPGDQRQPDRGAGVRAVPQRWRGGRGEPGHQACRKAGAGAVGRSHASQGRHLGKRTSRAINPQVANYDNNHSLILLLSKSNFFSYDSLDGGSSRVTGPSSL